MPMPPASQKSPENTACHQPIRANKDFLTYGAPDIQEQEIQEILQSLRSGWIGTGPKVHKFEEDFRAYKGASYAVSVNSCTAALHLSMLVSGIGPGDEVITTPMTFCATVNAIIHSRAKPVLADCDPDTLCINPDEIKSKITRRTKALVPVHFAGNSCEMDCIMDIARKRRLKVIEDCAHAIETTYKDKPAGTFGDFGCFSFYVTKNITTGEGGMILLKTKTYADRLKTLALHGMSKDAWKRFSDAGYKHYSVVAAGFKYNMTDMQAALGIHQLKRIEVLWRRRRDIWRRYQSEFANLPLCLPKEPPKHIKHAYHLYSVCVDAKTCGVTRDEFLAAMTRERIGIGVHYLSIAEHPFYQKTFGWKPKDYPVSLRYGRTTVSLPLSSKLTDDDVTDVIRAVKKILLR